MRDNYCRAEDPNKCVCVCMCFTDPLAVMSIACLLELVQLVVVVAWIHVHYTLSMFSSIPLGT